MNRQNLEHGKSLSCLKFKRFLYRAGIGSIGLPVTMALTSGFVSAADLQTTAAKSTRPNVLFIMTDQQRFDALSVHGGQAKTPNLDRLAVRGTDLSGFFSAAPVCVPSRCSLFTGRYGHSHRVLENDAPARAD